ncbi:hypothetical protein A3B02_00630 [Candidatus Roizmanbacteria bacterium RIFCSPLOWO2_01_FULL_42_14]|uniref:HTH cro/C1-type domain-containing protein n=4 Tax=Candidatus Roizmaniibacteriota TaxID=1752723 RepID=A0A1F7K032_9BACT|nr:MAG: hypothetical protein A3D08_01820 [Candidatus Roizmanbacteria bacterium RIFCSPHIGHO2_02_FULL_43_11]OGK37845.1 MAG: hypothetical protein A3F32_03305 [Candidatus Roizmanbacteria bacterium RIFCSPHIGHO2_12_FULL_42_10]OGK52274.1 MAG: hypothetical protein A3B02_00630 [Candidatus Roizmanbacteria bacterium RIFCSPLOWO2_01_FULL_42_14]OGK61226.1 MAG: hypothetical protein A3I56_04005 [Candidatus Roizmanbacteria bacterium RIFCSPLOWO2_02_FULL_43_10]
MSTDTSESAKLGQAIRKARKEIGLTQKDFADQLHISDKTVSAYEVGRATASFETLRKISKMVNKPLAYFDTDATTDDIDLQIKLQIIEHELLEIKKILKKK